MGAPRPLAAVASLLPRWLGKGWLAQFRLMRVAVVYADGERQPVASLEVAPGATVAEALQAAGGLPEFAGLRLLAMPVGLYGALVEHDQVLAEGDRVELYRPLAMDPREARRRRASGGR